MRELTLSGALARAAHAGRLVVTAGARPHPPVHASFYVEQQLLPARGVRLLPTVRRRLVARGHLRKLYERAVDLPAPH
jgi:hypothetical protein